MTVELSGTAIQQFLASLPEAALTSAPPSNLPTNIPLAWPSDLHHLNFLSTLHLVCTVLAQPGHSVLLAEIGEGPSDVALRGCLGLYLGSEQTWDASNYLSARAWREGALDEARVAEYFGITIHRERQHESMPITVGERYPPAVSVVGSLCQLFLTLGENISASCIGEDVVALLTASKEHTEKEAEPSFFFAKDFCHRATSLIPLLADFYPDPPGDVIPAAPLRLLQDLSYAFGPYHALFHLPELSSISNVSPLPLPIALLLHLGIIQPDGLVGAGEFRKATGDWWTGSKPDLCSPVPADTAKRPPQIVKVSKVTLIALSQASVNACSELASHARFGSIEWQKKMSLLDVSRVCAQLDQALDAHGKGVRLVIE